MFGYLRDVFRKCIAKWWVFCYDEPYENRANFDERVIAMEKEFLIPCGEWNVPCKLTQPDTGGIRRVVLGVHGIGGSAEDDIQVGIAEEMGMFSSATCRFDFPAHGQNSCSELTLKGCVESLVAVARDVRERYPQVEDLCIFASGFGAYVTLVALDELLDLPGRVKLVIQTPSVRMDETILAMKQMSRETLRAMDRTTLRVKRPIDVTYSFYKELRENGVMMEHGLPMLILHGEEDDFIRMEDIQQFHRLNEESKLVIIPGTSHRFLEDGAWDMVLDLMRDWFEFEQVLLSDWE